MTFVFILFGDHSTVVTGSAIEKGQKFICQQKEPFGYKSIVSDRCCVRVGPEDGGSKKRNEKVKRDRYFFNSDKIIRQEKQDDVGKAGCDGTQRA